MTKYSQVLFLYIDALRFDTFSNKKLCKILLPNLSKIINNGTIKKIISNGQVTQVSMPSIFCQRFPLDYDGYSTGIRNFPRSFVEDLKENGFHNTFIPSTYLTGPMWCLERGFDDVICIYDKRQIFDRFVRHFFKYYINEFDLKKITKKQLITKLKSEYKNLLDYLINRFRGVNNLKLPRFLRDFDDLEFKQLKKELLVLESDPEKILKKMKQIPPEQYFKYLGETEFLLNKKIEFLKITFKKIVSNLLSLFFLELVSIKANRMTPFASEVINFGLEKINFKKKNFIMFQFMDIHDSNTLTRFTQIFKLIRYLPKLLYSRIRFKSKSSKLYDLNLCYLDHQIGKLINTIKIKNKNPLIFITSDHGQGWDNQRKKISNNQWGFKTFYERIDVPLIISKKIKISDNGVHDSMSISATLIDLLKIKKHSSYLGKSIIQNGNKIVITEAGEPGFVDIKKHNLFFTVTSKKFKLFTKFKDKSFNHKFFFDKKNDPNEYENLIKDKDQKKNIEKLVIEIKKKRKKVIFKR